LASVSLVPREAIERGGVEKFGCDLCLGEHRVPQSHREALVSEHAPDKLEVARSSEQRSGGVVAQGMGPNTPPCRP
jgi:hypothetical protein